MPDHPFELLNEQSFQHFCQALLTIDFPNVRCFPVAQPDGGRDALVRSEDGLLIFQVKFSRAPENLKDPTAWVTNVLASEREKIEKLIERGATEYKLITNLSATSHLDVGSWDRVEEALSDLPIPAECWWRDDLNRRLDGAFDLKLAYTELLTGADLLRIIAERDSSSEGASRRQRAIKAYLVEQFEADREVRFKQTDLVNDLFSFFIDVPAQHLALGARATQLDAVITDLIATQGPAGDTGNPNVFAYGASSILLSERFQRNAPSSVVEGAPGQGKSTMLQYVCQVHRLRILESEISDEIPAEHLKSAVRLPFKVDLRDFARWLARDTPQSGLSDQSNGVRSLESFMAAEIEDCSGGATFDVTDLQAIVSESSVLLALDGLDEVGDTENRRKVMDAIEATVRRLEAVAPSLQTVLTSRPSPFVGAASAPVDRFLTLRLLPVGGKLVRAYADKWMDARRLSRRERLELNEVLDEKLVEPHIRDIAQNPMQLAILLDLVHRRGVALPDQRTTLYLSYMELFLDRESGKSEAVRKQRKLLITLHGYLAWLLHSQAEDSDGVGRFHIDEIEQAAGDFLESLGYERTLFGDLFAGVFDRVGALVSRVPETFEFEVQPLREFFAALYLYETASYSPPGEARTGTRPERFDVMVRRPYWLNVARFYAGCYDMGELPSLAERLGLLYEDSDWSTTTHPRAVATRLLADRTFQQDRRIQHRATQLLAADLAARSGVSEADTEHAAQSSVALPMDCGGQELSEFACAQLRQESHHDRRVALAVILRAQIPEVGERRARWLHELEALSGTNRDRWYRSARDLWLGDIGAGLGREAADAIGGTTVAALLYGGQFGVFDSEEGTRQQAVVQVLKTPEIARPRRAEAHLLPVFADLLMLDDVRARLMGSRKLSVMKDALDAGAGEYPGPAEFVGNTIERIEDPANDWLELAPWDHVVECGRKLFGDCSSLMDLAISATAFAGRGTERNKYGDLFDPSLSLCQRAARACLSVGDQKWWQGRLAEAETDDQRIMVLVLAWCWAAEMTLEAIRDDLLRVQGELSESSRGRLVDLAARCMKRMTRARSAPIRRTRWLEDVDALTFACASQRMPKQVALDLYLRSGPFEAEKAIPVASLLMRYEVAALRRDPGIWRRTADLMRLRTAEMGQAPWLLNTGLRQLDAESMPGGLARDIVQSAAEYPLLLVIKAETQCMRQVESNLESVGEIAAQDRWFAPA